MNRLRLLLLVTGVGALLTGAPCSALVPPSPGAERPTAAPASARAMAVLQAAARTSRLLAWTGTQRVVTVRGGLPRFSVLQVHHAPGTGSTVRVLSSDDRAVAADVLDPTLLALLAGHYELRLAGRQHTGGHLTQVVEALRPGGVGPAAVAGRFWVDVVTGMVVRRDVLDDDGSVVRSSVLEDLRMVSGRGPKQQLPAGNRAGQRLDSAALAALEDRGWPILRTLPSGLELFEARLHEAGAGDVLQLSYSDGLSTLSLFVQQGDLPADPDGTARPVGGGTVWVSAGSPERVVWSGDGRTWTLVSDAPETAVTDALLVLPHTQARLQDGPLARVWRGMSVVGAWLNPFS